MHASMVKPQDAVIVSVLAAVLALGLTLTTPMVGVQVVFGFLIVLVAFTSVPASLFLLIFSMLLSPEIAVGRVEGRGVGARELSLRVDDLLLVIIGFSWLVKTIVYRDLALIRETPINRPIVYYMLVCVLATLMGVMAGRVHPLTGFFFILKYFEYFFVFFMVVNHVSTKRQVVSLVTVLLAICFVISVYAIVQIPSGQRASAPFEGESGEPNTLGGYLVFIMAIVMGLFLHLKSGPIRVILVLLMGFISLALMATLSRSSYLAAGVLLLAVAATQWRRPGVVALILLLAVALPLVAPANVKNRVNETFFGRQYGGEITVGRVGLDLSTTERLRSWQYVLKDWLHSPLLGRGVTGYAWADAQYVKILGETGLAGLVAFIFLIVRLWRRARETFLAEQDPFSKGLAHGLLLGMVAMLAHGVGANTFIIIRIMEPFWLCAGLVMILPRLTSEADGPRPSASARMRWFLFCYWHEPDAPSDPVGLVRLWTLARQLVERGDCVTVFPPRYRSSLLQRGFSTVPIPLLPWPVLRPVSYAVLSCIVGLVQACRSKPDVVYYRWMDSPHPLLFARLIGAQCVCEVNGEPVPDWSEADRTLKRRLKHWLASFALSRCDRVVVLTDGLRDLVVRRYRVATERIAVLPSGTDTGLFVPQDATACRRRIGLDLDRGYIGFVGSFYRYQGLQCLLDAMAIIRRTIPSVHLLLVGDGEAAQELKQQADRLALSQCITWAGRIPYQEVPTWIGAMTLCVAPFRGDRGETSPVKIFDYLACGRPVIASAIPSVSATFIQEAGVALVPPDDPAALAQAVLALLNDQDRQARMAALGRRFVEQGFSWTHLTNRLREWLATEQASTHHAHPRVL